MSQSAQVGHHEPAFASVDANHSSDGSGVSPLSLIPMEQLAALPRSEWQA